MGGNPVNGRKENDFYPTPPDCVTSLLAHTRIAKVNAVWEPACGNGAISKVLENRGFTVISTDLNDYGYGTTGIDFLQCEERQADILITNPPFDIADKFIEKSQELGIHTVCMLLKCQYWHAKKRKVLFERYTPSEILAMTWRPNFSGQGSSTMDCIWTIWRKGHHEARYIPIEKVL